VHFGEKNLTNGTSTWIRSAGLFGTPCLSRPLSAITPWIALVACDNNSTDASDADDIFTLARDRGAVAAVRSTAIPVRPYSSPILYRTSSSTPPILLRALSTRSIPTPPTLIRSLISFQRSRSPLLGQLWVNSPGFPNLPPDRLIEERFDHINRSLYGGFNPQRLNDSFYVINTTLNDGNSTGPGYMFATLRAYNATEANVPPNTTPSNDGDNGDNQQRGKRTSLAMSVFSLVSACEID